MLEMLSISVAKLEGKDAARSSIGCGLVDERGGCL